MASKTYEIAFQLGARLLSSFGSTFNAATNNIKALEVQSKAANKGFLGLGEGATKVFKAATGAAAGIGFAEVIKQSVELASSLTEVQNVVDTTFGSGATQINAWSKTALNAYGLSELQAKQFTGTLGALMKSSGISSDKLVDMSEKLSGLSGDFASFYNLPIEEAFEKIRSGISGETEPLKALGVNMSVANLEAYALSQGITKSWNKMSQSEQTLLRYNYLLNASKDAQGDFNKTQNSFANQLRIAKTNLAQMGATLGTKVLPFLNQLLIYFNSGSIGKIGAIFSVGFDKAISVISSLKPNLDGLWNSIVRLTHVSGLDKIWSSLSSTEGINSIQIALKGIIDGFTEVVNFVTEHIDLITASILSIGSALATIKITGFIKDLKSLGAIAKVTTISKDVGFAFTAVRTGAATFGEAMTFLIGPVGIAVVVIAGLVAAGYLLYKNWDKISKFISNNWSWLKNQAVSIFTGIGSWISNNVTYLKNTISNVWNSIKTQTASIWNGITSTISKAWTSIVKSISSVWKIISTAVSNGWKAVIKAITSSALFKIVSAIFKGILAIVIIAVYNLYTRVVTGWTRIFTAVGNVLSKIWQVITRIWNSIYTAIAGVVGRVWSFIVSVWSTIYSTVSSIMARVWSSIVTIWNSIYNSVSAVLATIWNVIVRIWNTIYASVSSVLTSIWTFIVSVWNNVYSTVSSIITTIWNTIVNGFNSAASGVTSIFQNMYTSIVNIFSGIWSAIKSIINGGIGMLNGFIGGVNNMIEKANKVPGVNIGTVGSIPQLANGGYIKHRPGGILANIGEGSEDEIVSPVSKLKNIIKGASSSIVQQPTISYNPQIIIQGNASKDDVVEALAISQAEFNRMAENFFKSKQRLSFSNQ
ncbi:DNA-binding protein [Clostridium magnum]|uniref:Uncharacterized protein n=1 Tax=Clostridium magnum DSM 2767 TaxID=1121326 RepID=A0A162QML2_9CLOT|nr:DNA-binding protein [Clostridium magnum]KZL88717.1 hypothetical protein CLMAG_60060 [Clostridium magnum DSM 2767]SHJ43995.1 Phage-related protein [Clostridium magnum DSM 2767]